MSEIYSRVIYSNAARPRVHLHLYHTCIYLAKWSQTDLTKFRPFASNGYHLFPWPVLILIHSPNVCWIRLSKVMITETWPLSQKWILHGGCPRRAVPDSGCSGIFHDFVSLCLCHGDGWGIYSGRGWADLGWKVVGVWEEGVVEIQGHGRFLVVRLYSEYGIRLGGTSGGGWCEGRKQQSWWVQGVTSKARSEGSMVKDKGLPSDRLAQVNGNRYI